MRARKRGVTRRRKESDTPQSFMPPPPLSSTATYPIIRSQTKVETQNLASPVPSMPTYACYNTLPTNAFLPCRDAKSCVSRPVPYRHTHAIIRWQQAHISLVRRKILRLPSCPIPTYTCYNTLPAYAHLPRETQNLASLQGWRPHYACIYPPHPPCVLIRLPRYGGKNTCAIMTFRDTL